MSQNIYWYNDPTSCGILDASGESSVGSKLKLGIFLFNGSAIVHPLQTISAAPAGDIVRQTMYISLCDLSCNNEVLGYDYCNYRDCTWNSGTQLNPFACSLVRYTLSYCSAVRISSSCTLYLTNARSATVRIVVITRIVNIKLPDESPYASSYYFIMTSCPNPNSSPYPAFTYSYSLVLLITGNHLICRRFLASSFGMQPQDTKTHGDVCESL